MRIACKHSSWIPISNSHRSEDLILQVKCDLLFHWELVYCNHTVRGRRLHAQVCDVVNIQRVETLHWHQGSSEGEFIGDIQVTLHHHHHHRRLLRRSGHPISSWYQISSVSSVSIHQIIRRLVVFYILSRKSLTKILGFLVVCHSLDCIVDWF